MFSQFLDHGLPLVALKEQRRDLIVALMGGMAPFRRKQLLNLPRFSRQLLPLRA
jgi:hypothetical protein